MPDPRPVANDFVSQLTVIVQENLSNEQFGVSELADAMHMSRSNLLRKVKKLTQLSVSQFISQVRLHRGMELLRSSSLNVSEVAHQLGFNTTSYFIKCFREYYGYPPGEVGKRDFVEVSPAIHPRPVDQSGRRRRIFMLVALGWMVAFAAGFLLYSLWPSWRAVPLEKSIAVLPFKNESNDSTNVYLINGLMESTLNHLQKIGDLKVISRTSAEKYRNSAKSIPEMAQELHVNYFVEGSGQKIGDQILLNIQLIEASSDQHLWARQYKREANDIFQLQQEIARNIAQEIQAIITPAEAQRIDKIPTDDLVAYDWYLKGRDLFYRGKGSRENLEEALPYLKKAIEHDQEFALAYADAAIVYYYLDIFQTEKKYAVELSSYADQALLYDAQLGESLVAKALSYLYKKEYDLALPYLQKALAYNPNSGLVLRFLSEFYHTYAPNTAKYLEYALKGVRVDIASHDSATTSHNYLHLSNAFIQAGFVEEALQTINQSLAYNPGNPFAGWVKVLIRFAKHKNLPQTRELLIQEFNKDTTQFIIAEEIGKVSYLMRDYASAYRYYQAFIQRMESQQLALFQHESLKIALVLSKVGLKAKSQAFVKSFKNYADQDRSIYKYLNLAEYYAYQGDARKAMEHLKRFLKEDNYQYWVLLLADDPVVDAIKQQPEFQKIIKEIETKFWNNHKAIKANLQVQGLL